jgi:hypothetical protein
VDRCDECGFAYDEKTLRPLDALIAGVSGPYRSALAADETRLRRRPAPDVWSPLEYACHIRDVLLSQRERILTTLVEDRPSFPPMYRDRRVDLARYNEQDPSRVADEIEIASGLLSRQLGALDDEQLARECLYLFPSPAMRSVRWVGIHTLHECRHHLGDIERGLGT